MDKLNRMRVYVAGNPRTHGEQFRAFMDYIKDSPLNLVLSFDWLADMKNTPEQDGLEDQFLLRRYIAKTDLEAVRQADILVMFDSDKGWGMYVELGAALALGKRVIVINPNYLQVFYYSPLVCVVDNEEQAKERLKDLYEIATFAL